MYVTTNGAAELGGAHLLCLWKEVFYARDPLGRRSHPPSGPRGVPHGHRFHPAGRFRRVGKRDRILDLGTGSGILPVLLLSMAPAATASAVELSPEACKLAQTNFQCNGLSDRVQLIPGDLRQYRERIPAGAFDLTVSNPPYFETGTGYDASFGLKDARGDGTCTLEDLCTAAGWATAGADGFAWSFARNGCAVCSWP